MNQPVKVVVPIVLLGKENIRLQPSVLVQQLDEIEIECLQKYLPESAQVDVSIIDFNTPIYVSDLDVFKNENITVLEEPDVLVATLVSAAKAEEEEEGEEDVSPAEVPRVGEEDED